MAGNSEGWGPGGQRWPEIGQLVAQILATFGQQLTNLLVQSWATFEQLLTFRWPASEQVGGRESMLP